MIITPLLEWSLALPDAPELLEAEDHSKAGVFCSKVAIMTAGNGKPCVRCGTSEWDNYGNCRACKRARNNRWQQENTDKVAGASRQWKQSNPQKVADKEKEWRHANRSKVNAIKNRRRTRKTEAGGSFTAEEFNALCTHYGNRCLCCNRGNVKLTADHIKPVSKGGTSNIDNVQPLCGPCNSRKKDRHIDYRPDAGPIRWLQAKLFG